MIGGKLDPDEALRTAKANGHEDLPSLAHFQKLLREHELNRKARREGRRNHRRFEAAAPLEMVQIDSTALKVRWIDVNTRRIQQIVGIDKNHPNLDERKLRVWQIMAVDDHSRRRFLKYVTTHHITSADMVRFCCDLFCEWGVPKMLYTDNGPEFKALFAQAIRILSSMPAIRESGGLEHKTHAPNNPQASGKVDAAEQWLRAHDLVYDGLLEAPKGKTLDDWEPVELPLFRSTKFGDDQDRPIKKSNGAWTYFGADLAYHFQKAQTADQLIDIWGADHAGTVKRIQAAVAALTEGKAKFDVRLVQMVRLLRDGEPVKMSKRAGNFVTLADVVREVGKDVVRFTMLTRKSDAQMDFDFAKVVEASKDNPVFYVQYAHARISSLGRRAQEAGMALPQPDLSRLGTKELELVKLAAQFPRIVEAAAIAREPHRIAFYLNDLASAFHGWWNMGNDDPSLRVIVVNDPETTSARLSLSRGIGQVIRNGLALMGVEALSEMQ